MTTPHHHHWLQPPNGKEDQPPPYGIFTVHPLSARGENIDDPNYYMPFAPFGPPCTLPCKDEVWS